MVFIEAKTRKQAESMAPWACVIKKVCMGYMAFETNTEYQIWRNQK